MANKIITEKDFWMCTQGAAPAQLQGTRKSCTKDGGEIYITVEDKATSSWIDFGCTKYWMLAALAALAVVAVAIIVGALTVATGGLALVAIGALAALAGATIGLVAGALLCGQKVASKRVWSANKNNFIIQGTHTITGDHTMSCSVGGTVQFAPNIKCWTDALKVSALNYANILVEATFLGAGAGLLAAFATGAVVLAIPTVASVLTNVAVMGGAKVLSGAANYSRKDAVGEIHNSDEGWKAASPEYEAATRIYSNGLSSVSLSDVILFSSDILLPFLNVKVPGAKPPVPSVEAKAPDVTPGDTPADSNTAGPREESQPAKNEPEAPVAKITDPEPVPEVKPAKGGKGEAYENGSTKPKPGTSEHKAARWEEYQARGGKWDYARWSKQYDTNMQNVSHGLAREQAYRDQLGGTSKTVKTPYTNRQIDIYKPDEMYMGQLKTGKMSLTEQAKIDIQKDAFLVKEGYQVEYILEKGASKNFIDALEANGIEYQTQPKF